jgi:ABC-type polysaccharide/polyol phosphate export permease
MLLFLRNAGWTWLLAIPIMLGLLLFSMGVGLVLALVNARAGDVRYVVAVALSALYFLTPVLYPISMLDGQNPWLVLIVKVNPLSWYVQAMHDAMYSLVAPSPLVLLGTLVGGLVTFWLGLIAFERWGEDVGEYL